MLSKFVVFVSCCLSGQALADDVFKTPSGNLICQVDLERGVKKSVTCTMEARDGPSTLPSPTACNGLDWGGQVFLPEKGAAVVKCGGPFHFQTSLPITTARYGETRDYKGIRCTSATSGLSCRNASGHGFLLSRRRQSTF